MIPHHLIAALDDIEGIAGRIRPQVADLLRTSAVTLSKAAETDRLTDENRALRQKVETLESELAEQKMIAQENDVDARIEALGGPAVTMEHIAAIVQATAHEVDGPSGYAMMRLAAKLRGER